MNCPNCGNSSKPGEKFCMVCGYMYPQQPQMQYQQPGQIQQNNGMQNQYQNAQYQNSGKAPKSGKKFPVVPVVIGVVALALVAVLVFLGIKFLGKGETIESCLDKFCDGIKENDEDLFNESIDESFVLVVEESINVSDELGLGAFDSYDSYFDAIISEVEDDFGEIEEVSYKIKDQEEVDADEIMDMIMGGNSIDEIEESMKLFEEYYDGPEYKALMNLLDIMREFEESIEEADELLLIEVKFNYEGEDGKGNETVEFYAIKKDGKWGLIPATDDILNF